jgi:ribose 5-phosphate isomerase B
MKLYIGSDHAGFNLKSALLEKLTSEGHEVVDLGTNSLDSCHYPEYATNVAKEVSKNDGKGILVCGSGIGVSMVANRYQNVRAALCRSSVEAELSRQHNNSNIICLGERLTEQSLAFEIVDTWLKTDFEGGRHQGRVDLFNSLGEKA